jgi:murein DD-endopeptidase MepM/ murein hydrolase activator NlpD
MIWGGVLVAFMGTSCSNHEDQSSMNKVPCDYQSPVDYDITLAGNFGEPRPWHFHGGLDIKTNNQEGKQIFSIADGYVCRLTVNKFGFGNAIYVSHPDGHTSIYCHLQKFAPCYEEQLKRTGRDTLDIHFADNQFPVRAGHLIAFSGNTGHSTGPHLHLEIHDTQTWAMRDPMEFLGHLIADSIAPQAHSLMAVPVEGQGVFNGVDTKQIFGFGSERQKSTKFNAQATKSFHCLRKGRLRPMG